MPSGDDEMGPEMSDLQRMMEKDRFDQLHDVAAELKKVEHPGNSQAIAGKGLYRDHS